MIHHHPLANHLRRHGALLVAKEIDGADRSVLRKKQQRLRVDKENLNKEEIMSVGKKNKKPQIKAAFNFLLVFTSYFIKRRNCTIV